MATIPSGVPNPTNTLQPIMKLPDHVDGFIDLKTLKDIHHCLNESTLEDDLAIAAWVKKHYLYEPIKSEGREINSTEGFLKLHTAYLRVKSLTNKAQDKWPFFDRNWKSMNAKTVRRNGKGEAALGVSAHDSSILPSKQPEQKEDPIAGPTLATTPSDDLPQSRETAQDAGRNWDFMPKQASSKAKAVPKAKTAKKALPEPLTPKSPQPASPSWIEPLSPAAKQAWFGPPLLLAAHAPSIWSSLDKLPPGCARKNKRKRDSAGEDSPRKRSPATTRAKTKKESEEEMPRMATRRSARAKEE
ncbi:hypothetical protein BDU57DRAFT_514681 [Ampelomyces quisqualis]|uniref:Uncharacterized protein n=1 Tax=Ampelomyces quisqualis TaxID=50730 RepID=A0A6A5QW71_AMPQU|nr:hypothetical protein BDU57DRAFT_514681 [Ampelomyces quisqualis]